MIPLFKVAMHESAPARVKEVLESGYIGEGKVVQEFTERCKELIGCKYAVATNSGTSALQLALFTAGIGPGSKVISTPMTCLATNTAIRAVGADIIWADVEPVTGNINPSSVEEILQHDTVDAVMCVHWAGNPCEMDYLLALAEAHGIILIEDAAHAWLAEYEEERIGSFGHMTCFSFQAIKHLTSGDGGLLTMSSKHHYETARLAKWFGLDRELSADMRCQQDPPTLGFKYHMNDIAAAIGLANLEGSKARVLLCRINAARYDEAFKDLKGIFPISVAEKNLCSYWLYPLLVDNSTNFIAHMMNNGIACSKAHARNDTKRIFRAYQAALPGVDYFDEHQVNIPVGWWLSGSDVEHVIQSVRSYVNGNHTSKKS